MPNGLASTAELQVALPVLNPVQSRPIAINVADLSPANDPFTLLARESLDWIGFSGIPANAFERNVRGVALPRYRAAFQAALALKSDRFIISHLPMMTAAVSTAMSVMGKRAPHLAFSFNFTELPNGRRLSYLRRSLRDIDQFAVYSRFESPLYGEHFDIDPARIKSVIWTQDVPTIQAEPGIAPGLPYVCALGGEGRDFKNLIEAARRIGPTIRLVVIARPHSLAGISIPDHVQVLTNIPAQRAWRIACDSLGVLVPLKSRETCCGQITLVSAKMLGLPVVTTFSHATREYVEGREAVLVCEPNDVAAFARLIEQLVDEHPRIALGARNAIPRERAFHNRSQWARYLRDFLTEKVI